MEHPVFQQIELTNAKLIEAIAPHIFPSQSECAEAISNQAQYANYVYNVATQNFFIMLKRINLRIIHWGVTFCCVITVICLE